MTDRASRLLLPIVLGVLVQGCAAALVPAAIGGIAARRHLKAPPGQAAAVAATPAAKAPAAGATVAETTVAETAPAAGPRAATGGPATAPLPAAPSDLALMTPQTLYRGNLPSPASAAPATAPAPAPALSPVASPGSDVGARASWDDVTHYVASRFGQTVSDSVLLDRGSTLAAPRWTPCGTKPVALLADLDAVVPRSGPVPQQVAAVLGAVETLEAVVYTSRRTGEALDRALAALGPAGLRPPAAGRTLFTIAPGQDAAARATIGARFCVIAIAGDQREDFPNAGAVGAGGRWPGGWFLVPGV